MRRIGCCLAALLLFPALGLAQDLDEYEDELILPKEERAVNVVQKKQYLKGGKLEITPTAGIVLNDNFLRITPFGGILDYYFNEYWALEVEGYSITTQPSSFTRYLKDHFNIVPEYNEQKWSAAGGIQWSPLYGKMSFLASSIIPYDMYFTLTGGMTGSTSGSYPQGSFTFGQRYFIHRFIVFRMALRFTYIKEQIQSLDPETGIPISGLKRDNNKYDLGAFGGFSIFLPAFEG